MARLPPLRRLIVQDYQSQAPWIGPVFQNLNNYMESSYNALNSSLTLNDNTTGGVISIVLTSQPSSTNPAKVQWNKTTAPISVLLGNVQQRTVAPNNALTTSGTLLTDAPAIEWQYITDTTGNYIYITNLVGCPAPTSTVTITLQLVVFTG